MIHGLSPTEALDRLRDFAGSKCESAVLLAMHCAVARVLDAELVHLVRRNFVLEAEGKSWVEADVLFSDLCTTLGAGFFEFEPTIRRQLVDHLVSVYESRDPARVERVAAFVWARSLRVKQARGYEANPLLRRHLELQLWDARAFLDPNGTAKAIATALAKGDTDAAVSVQVGRVASALSIPLAGHAQLIAYAQGVSALEAGDRQQAQILHRLGDTPLVVEGVQLESPRSVLAAAQTARSDPNSLVPEVERTDKKAAPDDRAAVPVGGDSCGEPCAPDSNSNLAAPLALPRRVFLSYRRNAEPNRSLCDHLSEAIMARGHDVFVDRQLAIGSDWSAEIQRALEEADFLVLLMSEESSYSEMVWAEVEQARAIAARRNGAPKILPVRVAFRGKLPYPLSAYTDRLQHLFWGGESDTAAVTASLLQTIEGHVSAPRSVRQYDEPPVAELERPPAHARLSESLNTPGGTVGVDDPMYISRECDADALRVIRRGPGQTITIKGPRQVGKSSLLMRILSAAMRDGRKVALVDFQLLAANTASESRFLESFLREILHQLDLPPLKEGDWDSWATPAQNCTTLFDRLVLRPLQNPLTLACDEAELVLALPFRDSFFGMMRAWHGKRANPTLRQRWGTLDLILVTSTEPYLFIDRADQSPFNVGAVLALEDLNREQVARLNASHGTPLASDEVDALLELTGGHPYLVRRALYAVAASGQAMPWREVLSSATEYGGPFGDHMTRHLLNVLRTPELKHALSAVLAGRYPSDEVAVHRLLGAGLVRRQGERVLPRCSLYARYFKGKI